MHYLCYYCKWRDEVKKYLFFVMFLCLIIFSGCNNLSDNSNSNQNMAKETVEEDTAEDNANIGMQKDDKQAEETDSETKVDNKTDRKVIYNADLQIEVQNYEQTFNNLDEEITALDGYIVDSNINEDEEDGSKNGHITARIPQEDFKSFIKTVEKGSSKVLESSTSGEDVTEEYVDLESRLNSKEVVEDRLLTFMEEADKTEDLLKISNDLAEVQEEIEALKGQINYLDDKSDLATVSIYMQEENVALSGIDEGELNTWEKTKQQLMKSINFLISAFSGIFIFIVGNLPVFILLGIIGFIIYLIIRRMTRNRKES